MARYESRVGDNHHHMVCRSCSAITDVDCAVGEAPCLTASDDHGYSIDEAEVTYWGLCPDCSAARPPDQFPLTVPRLSSSSPQVPKGSPCPSITITTPSSAT